MEGSKITSKSKAFRIGIGDRTGRFMLVKKARNHRALLWLKL